MHCFFRPKTRHSVRPHAHPFVEWHYVIGGACDLAVGTDSWRIVRGDLCAVPAGVPHGIRMRRADDWLLQYIVEYDHADESELCAAWTSRTGPVQRMAIGLGHQALFARCARACSDDDPWARGAAQHRFQALLCDLIGRAGAADPAHPAIAQALAIMHQRLRGHLTLAELADRVALSRHHLARLFTAEIGTPPLRHFTHLKMQLAASLLSDSDEPITAVAATLGYDDPFHFSRVFRRTLGRSPSAWRREER